MTKRMLIDAMHPEETRVVIAKNEKILDFDFVTTSKAQIKGNIYLAKITRVEPSLQAAFVEYGGGKQGFLPFSEIHPDYYQLPTADRQKLVEEQIAEAEAEEAAEEELYKQSLNQGRRGNRRPDNAADMVDPESDLHAMADALDSNPMPDPAPEAIPGTEYAPLEIPQDEVFSAIQDMPIEPDTGAEVPVQDLLDDASLGAIPVGELPAPEIDSTIEETGGDDLQEEARSERQGRAFYRRYRIQEVIKRNQIILVQAIKEERGNKGASLTTYISLAGRYCVLMPNSPKGGGISRKITEGSTRRRLKEIASELKTHRGMSVIIRTAGLDQDSGDIRRDYDYLTKLWNQIRENTLASSAPAVVYEEGDIIKRSIRDLYTTDIQEIVVEGNTAYKESVDFMSMLMPTHTSLVRQHTDKLPIFASYGIEEQMLGMTDPQVKLPSGGYIVIQQTEALISIDVNSGRSTSERNVEETAIKTNMEAAAEVARQLKLRDLAGLIVVDFIDMNYGKNRRLVERAMKDALKHDRAKIQLGRISSFGLMELSRQRLRPSISESMGTLCPHCKGTGFIQSVETVGIQVVRTLESEAASGQYTTLRVSTYPEAALHLMNEKRALLQSIEERFKVKVIILVDTSIITGNFRLVMVTPEGKETLHDDGRDKPSRRGGRKRGKRGGRGRERDDEGSSFGDAQDDSDDSSDESDGEGNVTEVAGGGGDGEDGRPRRERGRRGGRRRRGGRDRERGERPEGEAGSGSDAPREAREPREPRPMREPRAPREAGEGLDENGAPREGENGEPRRRRSRGRRGGRGRGERRPREEGQGPRQEHSADGSSQPASSVIETRSWDAAPAPREEKPQPAIVVQSTTTHAPTHTPAPDTSEDTSKPKRRGWWSRVTEG